jgi:hypothetical protein
MYDVVFPTTDETTVQTTPQTVLEAGVSFPSLKPNASSCKQIRREAVSDEYYSVVGSAPKPVPARR